MLRILRYKDWRSTNRDREAEVWCDRSSVLASPFEDKSNVTAYKRWLWRVIHQEEPQSAAWKVAEEQNSPIGRWCPPATHRSVTVVLDGLVERCRTGETLVLVCRVAGDCACCQAVKSYVEHKLKGGDRNE